MGVVDYYQLLGVSRNATKDDIKRAFRARILDIHPDHNPDSIVACESARELIDAYRVLIDPIQRSYYNTSLAVPIEKPIEVFRHRNWSPQTIASRVTVLAIGVMIALIPATFVWQVVFAQQGPVYRPFINEVLLPVVSSHMPTIVEPKITEDAWYQSQDYQIRLANEWSAHQMRSAYNNAVQHAEKSGNIMRAAFYRSRIEEMHDPQTAKL